MLVVVLSRRLSRSRVHLALARLGDAEPSAGRRLLGPHAAHLGDVLALLAEPERIDAPRGKKLLEPAHWPSAGILSIRRRRRRHRSCLPATSPRRLSRLHHHFKDHAAVELRLRDPRPPLIESPLQARVLAGTLHKEA